GDTVIDIGANIGLVTLLMAKLTGRDGRVYAFEPNPLLGKSLRVTLSRNKIANVEFYPFALGDAPRRMTLHVPSDNNGSGSLVHDRGSSLEFLVEVRRLDDVLEGSRNIAVIKLDVEGFEYEVMRGAEKIISQTRPRAVLFECNS